MDPEGHLGSDFREAAHRPVSTTWRRMTYGGPARGSATVAGGELDQIQFLLGHASIQTTERYPNFPQYPKVP